MVGCARHVRGMRDESGPSFFLGWGATPTTPTGSEGTAPSGRAIKYGGLHCHVGMAVPHSSSRIELGWRTAPNPPREEGAGPDGSAAHPKRERLWLDNFTEKLMKIGSVVKNSKGFIHTHTYNLSPITYRVMYNMSGKGMLYIAIGIHAWRFFFCKAPQFQ